MNLRRALQTSISVVLAAAAVWAAVAGLDALISWRVDTQTPLFERGGLSDDLALAALGVAALVGIFWMLGRAFAPARKAAASDHPDLARLASEARTDSLTRLANRRAFHDHLATEIDRRNSTGTTFSLMAVDLNGLKTINDTLGHQAGDTHIVRIAQALQATAGESGTVYRTGGDEFMILLPNLRNWHAINLAHRIHAATASDDGTRALSIGVTETKGTEHRTLLVHQADIALYEAKRARLAVVAYQPGLEPLGAEADGEGLSPHLKALASALARTLDARDHGSTNHSEIVAELAAGVAARLGIEGLRLERVRVAALLHDVGKISTPDVILKKPTALSMDETTVMREHVSVGRDILVAAGFAQEATWVFHHHEHYDGTGYPQGLVGDEIPLESRIVAVADAFDAMTGARLYRETRTIEEALAELRAHGGTQFDAACVQAVADMVEDVIPSAAPDWPPPQSSPRTPQHPSDPALETTLSA